MRDPKLMDVRVVNGCTVRIIVQSYSEPIRLKKALRFLRYEFVRGQESQYTGFIKTKWSTSGLLEKRVEAELDVAHL